MKLNLVLLLLLCTIGVALAVPKRGGNDPNTPTKAGRTGASSSLNTPGNNNNTNNNEDMVNGTAPAAAATTNFQVVTGPTINGGTSTNGASGSGTITPEMEAEGQKIGMSGEDYRKFFVDGCVVVQGASSSFFNRGGPMSPRQRVYLNQMGVLECDMDHFTFGEANDTIQVLKDAHSQFKDEHEGKQPVSGAQKTLAARKKLDLSDCATKEDASAKLNEAADTEDDEPATSAQLAYFEQLKERTKYQGPTPTTKSACSTAIDGMKKMQGTARKATQAQVDLIMKKNPKLDIEAVRNMTIQQAAALIAAYIAAQEKSKKKK